MYIIKIVFKTVYDESDTPILLGDSQLGYCGNQIGRNFTVFRKEDSCNYSRELDNEDAVKKTNRHNAATVLLR